MALKTLHLATTGLLAGATLAIATEGLLQPQVEVVSKPAPSHMREFTPYKPPRRPRIIHALKFELESSAEIILQATSRYEIETEQVTETSYNSIADVYFNAESYYTGKNVRVTNLESEAEVVLELTSNISLTANDIREYKKASDSNLNFEIESSYSIQTGEKNYASIVTSSELYFEVSSSIHVVPVDDTKDELEEILAVAMAYLYG